MANCMEFCLVESESCTKLCAINENYEHKYHRCVEHIGAYVR